MKPLPVKYDDRLFRWILALAGAYLVTEFGGEDGYFSYTRLFTRAFLIEFGSSVIIALILVEFIAWITRFLDRRYDWKEQIVIRICLQVVLGIMAPSVMDFLLASLYFEVFDRNIFETIYLQYAMPYIVVMLTLFNLYYVIHYLYRRAIAAEQSAWLQSPVAKPQPELPGSGAAKAGFFPANERGGTQKPVKQVFLINKGTENVLIPVEEICYFFHEKVYNFLRTFQGDTAVIAQSLDEVEKSICERQFFRLNRQIIINHKAFKNFVVEMNGKLKVSIMPPVPDNVSTIVSQKKAARFREWLDR